MNALVLTGLVAAVALVIDDAVVTVDHVTRRLREAKRAGVETSSADVVREAALEVRRPALYAALVVGLATLPFLFLNEVAGAFFPDLVWAFLVAVLASLVVEIALTPTLCVLLLGRISPEPHELALVASLRSGYRRGLARIVHRPGWAFGVVAVLAVAGAVSASFLSNSLLPNIKESQLLIPWNAPVGTSLPEMNRITARATHELRGVPGVTSVGAHVGRAVTADRVVNVNSAEIWVGVDQSRYDSTVRSIRRVIDHYPGFSRDIESFSNARVRGVLTGSDSDVVVRVYGDARQVLQSAAGKVRNAVATVDGVDRARIAEPVDQPTLQIKVDLAAAERVGIRPGDIRREASTLLSGLQVGSLFEAQKVFDVIVRGTPSTRSSLTSVRRLLIDTPGGGHVRLGQVASVRIAAEPANIRRQASSTYLDVDVSVSGRDRGAVVSDIRRGLQGLALPLEYHAEVLGSQGQPVGKLLALAIAAGVGIFLLLQALFGSWRVAAVASFVPALAIGGGLVATRAGGGTLSFGSYAALFAVFGVAASNSIVLLDRLRQRERAGEALDPDLVVDVAGERFLPVVTTALATALAMIPLVVFGDIPGLELVHPLAIAALGGLVAATAATLVVAPSLYLRFCRQSVPAEEDETEVLHGPEAVVVPDAAG
jgi:Cu/Ag efflux pump CusA